MSVLIKGMDMPKNGEITIYNNCPLVEIPTPHGDLIDRNRIIYELCESNMPEIYRDFCRRVLTDNTLTPTIIEAEE